MYNQPLVTIGAINYNNSKYLIETLESIKAQSYENIELIIVDDCSTGNDVVMINEWLKSYNKSYKFIQHEENKGVCKTINQVLKNASGKYISTIATDDIMMPDKIKVQVEILENSKEDVCAVYSDAYLIKEDSSSHYGWFIQRYRQFSELPQGYLYDVLFEGNFLPAMSLLIKKECFDNIGFYNENLAFEDYDMWLRLSRKYKFSFSEYVSVKYRIRSSSLSFNIKWLLSYIKIYNDNLNFNPVALKKLEKIFFDSYILNDKEILNNLKLYRKKSKILNIIYTLWICKVNKKIGGWLIKRMK